MKVLVHAANPLVAPEGVWWFDGSARLGEFYRGGQRGRALQAVGRDALGSVAVRADQVDVEEFFYRLAERSPRPDVWDVVEISDANTPVEYLDMVRRLAKTT